MDGDLGKISDLIANEQYDEAEKCLRELASVEIDAKQDGPVRLKTQAIMELGALFARLKKNRDLLSLVAGSRSFLSGISKARASKVIRTLVDQYLDIGSGVEQDIVVCQENIKWAETEERTFLRQGLEVRLITLYLENRMYDEGLDLVGKLLKELRKVDDKHVLVDVQLLESRLYYCLGNLARSRASLTTARTTATTIYCPPKLQASLDMQSGIMHAAESDFKTAYSYFYEAFDGFNTAGHKRAVTALKYMLMCKIMMNRADDIKYILSGKMGSKYSGREIDSMKKIAAASKARCLAQFEEVVKEYSDQLREDNVVKIQLNRLYDTLFDENLSRLIEPFSTVEITHIASLINRSKKDVEKKLSTMILDKRLNGILDQHAGILKLYETQARTCLYTEALLAVNELNKVVDVLFTRAQAI